VESVAEHSFITTVHHNWS